MLIGSMGWSGFKGFVWVSFLGLAWICKLFVRDLLGCCGFCSCFHIPFRHLVTGRRTPPLDVYLSVWIPGGRLNTAGVPGLHLSVWIPDVRLNAPGGHVVLHPCPSSS
jgi:hypothetical protein